MINRQINLHTIAMKDSNYLAKTCTEGSVARAMINIMKPCILGMMLQIPRVLVINCTLYLNNVSSLYICFGAHCMKDFVVLGR